MRIPAFWATDRMPRFPSGPNAGYKTSVATTWHPFFLPRPTAAPQGAINDVAPLLCFYP